LRQNEKKIDCFAANMLNLKMFAVVSLLSLNFEYNCMGHSENLLPKSAHANHKYFRKVLMVIETAKFVAWNFTFLSNTSFRLSQV